MVRGIRERVSGWCNEILSVCWCFGDVMKWSSLFSCECFIMILLLVFNFFFRDKLILQYFQIPHRSIQYMAIAPFFHGADC